MKVVAIAILKNYRVITIDDYEFPHWSHALGTCMTLSVVFATFGTAIYTAFDYGFNKRVKLLID
jgi:hypothetical protein